MSTTNQVQVSFESGFLIVVNVDGVNPNFEKLEDISHVHSVYFDLSALNAYQPGLNEYDENLEVKYRLNGISDDNPLSTIDINKVTNQPTWTKDKTGLYKAVSDLILASNTSGGAYVGIAQTDVSAIGATENIDVPFYTSNQWSIQFVWAGLDAADGTIGLQVSNDGVNFEDLDGFTTITMSTTPADSSSVNDDNFDFNYLRIVITKNSLTTGTIYYNIKR